MVMPPFLVLSLGQLRIRFCGRLQILEVHCLGFMGLSLFDSPSVNISFIAAGQPLVLSEDPFSCRTSSIQGGTILIDLLFGDIIS
jgi:hypothetical protein